MRRWTSLLLGLSLTFASSAALASAALVQNNTATGTTSVAPKWGTAVTAGHLLVATVTAASASTISAPAGWTAITSIDNPTKVMVAMYYIENCSAKAINTTETFTATGSNGTTVRLMEYSGILASGSLDVSGTATGGQGAAVSVSTSGAVATSPSLGVAILSHQIADVPDYTATAPYADVSAYVQSANNVEDTIYNTSVGGGVASTAAVSGTGHSWAAAIAVFKEAPLYWRGGLSGCDGNFTTTACWSTSSGGASAGVVPGTTDRANFDGGGTGNCALSSAAATQVGSISTTSGYTGTITQGTQNVTLSSDLSIGGGTFMGHSGQTIATNLGGSYTGGLVVSGGTFNGNGATIAVQTLAVSGGTLTVGSGNLSTNNGGTAAFSGGTSTFAGGTSSFAGTLTTSGSGTSVTFGAGAPTVTGLATFSGGMVAFGAGQLLLNGGLDVEGATVTLGSSASTTTVTGTATVGAGTLNFTNGAATTDFSNTLLFTQSGGTINVNGATVALGSTITTASTNAFTQSGGTFNNTTMGGALSVGTAAGGGGIMNQSGSTAVYNGIAGATETFNGPLNVSGSMSVGTVSMTGTGGSGTRKDITINSGGTMTLSSAGFTFSNSATLTVAGTLNAGTGTAIFNDPVSVTGTLDGSSGTQQFAKALTVSGGLLKTGSTSMTGTTAADRLVTISSGTMTLGSAGFTFNSTTAMPIGGTLNLAGAVSFAGALTLTGALNVGSTTTTIPSITMTGTSSFNGGTGTTTFSSAPTITGGTFTVATAGSAGKVILSAGASFPSGTTLAFPTSGGTLSAPGQTVTLNGGTVTSSAGAAATPPKITGASGSGVTVTISSGTLNVDGLELDFVVPAGVTIASGVTYTLLSHLTFKNNIGGATSTHLAITLASGVVAVSGCYFDTTATNNVTLFGTSGNVNKAHAIFEFQSTTINGSGAGESRDADGDTNDDNVGDTTGAPYYGSVVEWTYASPSDVSGTSVGPPTAVFNWNTFAYEGVYVTYNGTAASTNRLWKRNTDGTSAYYFDFDPTTYGNIVGVPRYDTILDESAGDVDGDGATTSTNLRVVYIGTALGHIIKLIDNGTTAFSRPGSHSVWNTDFTDTNVSTITSQLVSDRTNLYFGGTGGGATKIFGVQIATTTGEKTLVKNIGTTGTGSITTAPSWTVYSGATYLYIGSKAVSSQAYVYRAQVSPGATVDQSYAGSTTDINGGVTVINDRAFAVSAGGKLYELDASNFATSGFTTLTGFPYSGFAAISCPPFVDVSNSTAYFGDANGNLYVVQSDGTNLAGYPYAGLAGVQITSTVLYLQRSGTMAAGASDGYAYFINRRTVTAGSPAIRKRFYVGNGNVTSISYNSSTSQYMAGSSDGRLLYVNTSDVGSDSDGVE